MNIDEIIGVAKETMLKHGRHYPTVLVETTKDRYMAILDFLPKTTLDKEKLLFTSGRGLATAHHIDVKDVRQLVWICEAWFAKMKPGEERGVTTLVNHPKRQEGLIVLSLTIAVKEVTQSGSIIEVIRQGGSLDLLPYSSDDEVKSNLLTSCLAGIGSAALSEQQLAEIVKKAIGEQP